CGDLQSCSRYQTAARPGDDRDRLEACPTPVLAQGESDRSSSRGSRATAARCKFGIRNSKFEINRTPLPAAPMTFLPIVDRELRVAARRKGTYWSRLLAALLALLIFAGFVTISEFGNQAF